MAAMTAGLAVMIRYPWTNSGLVRRELQDAPLAIIMPWKKPDAVCATVSSRTRIMIRRLTALHLVRTTQVRHHSGYSNLVFVRRLSDSF